MKKLFTGLANLIGVLRSKPASPEVIETKRVLNERYGKFAEHKKSTKYNPTDRNGWTGWKAWHEYPQRQTGNPRDLNYEEWKSLTKVTMQKPEMVMVPIIIR